MEIIPRSAWGARAPRDRDWRTWADVVDFAVHYSGASEDQTPRSIQNFHMDTRGWSDVGYNFLINKRGQIFEGRGFLVVGAHIANHNTPTMGVCFIGEDRAGRTDVTPEAKRAGLWLLAECNRRKRAALGARAALLRPRGHGSYSGASTSCPGGELRSWLAAGLPAPAGTPTTPPATPPAPNWTETLMNTLPTLRSGSGGRRVSQLQALCNVVLAELRTGLIEEDGDFGPATERAVKVCQRALRIEDDGVCGPITWRALLSW